MSRKSRRRVIETLDRPARSVEIIGEDIDYAQKINVLTGRKDSKDQ